jgi:hypothetical protein
MSEGPIPNSWREAIPVVIWVVLVLAFGFLFVESLGQLFEAPVSRAIFAIVAMLGLLAMLIYRAWLLERFKSLSGASVLAAILVSILVLTLSPYVEQQRWPFISWFAPAEDVAKAPASSAPKPLSDDEKQFRFDLRKYVRSSLSEDGEAFLQASIGIAHIDSNTKLDIEQLKKYLRDYYQAYEEAKTFFQSYLYLSGQDANQDTKLSRWLDANARAVQASKDLESFPTAAKYEIRVVLASADEKFRPYLKQQGGGSPVTK